MTKDEISVRQWQEQYQAGAFSARDTDTQYTAGWESWVCQDYALADRLKKIAPVVMGITDPYILDNFYDGMSGFGITARILSCPMTMCALNLWLENGTGSISLSFWTVLMKDSNGRCTQSGGDFSSRNTDAQRSAT